MGYTVKKNVKFEVRFYIGSKEGYNGPVILPATLKAAIKQYQHEKGLEKASPVRVTATTYLWDDYEEDGWEVGIICYPRRPLPVIQLRDFATNLAAYLLERFKQNRISIVFPDEIVMLENDSAEVSHKAGKSEK